MGLQEVTARNEIFLRPSRHRNTCSNFCTLSYTLQKEKKLQKHTTRKTIVYVFINKRLYLVNTNMLFKNKSHSWGPDYVLLLGFSWCDASNILTLH